ncbi:MAG: DUF2071 domain-containing protein [Pirellulaceae bacterium]
MRQPSLDQRLATRALGVKSPVMYQRWSDLLFVHWRWDAADLAGRLPAGISVDTFDGSAWVGVVPFFMQRIRPRFLPAVPGISWFLELNVRTYVYDSNGTSGVWFFSLDCNQRLAVQLARKLFHLPYFDARMSAMRSAKDNIEYDCCRRRQTSSAKFNYRIEGEPYRAEPGTLEFFLTERYVLFSESPSGLHRGQVEHKPYPLSQTTVEKLSAAPLLWNGFAAPSTKPDHIIGSRGVDVRIGKLERL